MTSYDILSKRQLRREGINPEVFYCSKALHFIILILIGTIGEEAANASKNIRRTLPPWQFDLKDSNI